MKMLSQLRQMRLHCDEAYSKEKRLLRNIIGIDVLEISLCTNFYIIFAYFDFKIRIKG